MRDLTPPRAPLGPAPYRVLRRAAILLRQRALADWAQRREDRAAISRDILLPSEALLTAERFDEAEALVWRGLASWPGDPRLLAQSARVAQMARWIAVAIERGEAALHAAPDQPARHTFFSGVLRAGDQAARASEIMRGAARRFPGEVSVIAETGRVAEARADYPEALGIWQRLCTRRDPKPEWLQRHAVCLVMLKRFDEAEALISACLADRRIEADSVAFRSLLSVRGILLSAREDWPASVAFWTEFQARFPDSQTGWEHLGRALHNRALAQVDDLAMAESLAIAREPAKIEVVADDVTKTLLLGFESIGDSCEFGLVQRRYGAEPLSLLRWNSVSLGQLISALAADLEGLGEPEHTELVTIPNGEFMIRDRRWGFDMHTWLFVGYAEPDALYKKMCRRVVFLRDKFLTDLRAAEKIVVFRSAGLEDAAFEALHRALRRFGPVQLLVIQPARGANAKKAAPGEVIKLADGRYLGFIGRFGLREDGFWDIVFDDWVSVCAKVVALVSGDGIMPSDPVERPGLGEVARARLLLPTDATSGR